MANDNCGQCGAEIQAVNVIQAEVGIFDDGFGEGAKRKIDLIVACPDCGCQYYTFVDMKDLIREDA